MKVLNQCLTSFFALYNGDSCEVMQGLKDNSMGYSIFSPPFEDLYTYSDSPRDLGNCRSTEEFYQAIRRCYRFGQKQEVNVHIIISEKEMNVLNNIKRKQADHERMSKEMVKIMSENAIAEFHHYERKQTNYFPDQEMQVPEWLPF